MVTVNGRAGNWVPDASQAFSIPIICVAGALIMASLGRSPGMLPETKVIFISWASAPSWTGRNPGS